MPSFPRAAGAKPRLATVPRFPQGLSSWGESGKGQLRAVQNMGRTWEEVYPVLDASLQSVRALLEAINRSLREPTLWDVQHPYWHERKGAGGGTPLVNGPDQTGSNLVVDGGPVSVAGWLLAGDIIKVAGAAVILDVTGTVGTNASGQATIPISPPLFQGQSPADDAVVTIDPAQIVFKAYIVDVGAMPEVDSARLLPAGLTVGWREQPSIT